MTTNNDLPCVLIFEGCKFYNKSKFSVVSTIISLYNATVASYMMTLELATQLYMQCHYICNRSIWTN